MDAVARGAQVAESVTPLLSPPPLAGEGEGGGCPVNPRIKSGEDNDTDRVNS
jgi:hypothetical protein